MMQEEYGMVQLAIEAFWAGFMQLELILLAGQPDTSSSNRYWWLKENWINIIQNQ